MNVKLYEKYINAKGRESIKSALDSNPCYEN